MNVLTLKIALKLRVNILEKLKFLNPIEILKILKSNWNYENVEIAKMFKLWKFWNPIEIAAKWVKIFILKNLW